MSVQKLQEEILEYHQRVQEVLSGMDRMLTGMNKRLKALEDKVDGGAEPAVLELREQVAALGETVAQLLADRN